jgi:hypothetical protein
VSETSSESGRASIGWAGANAVELEAELYEAFRARPSRGRLTLDRSGILFELPDREIRIDAERLAARYGGFNDGVLFLEDAQAPGLRVVCADPATRSPRVLALLPGLARAQAAARARRRRFWGCVLALLAAAAIVVVAVLFGALSLLRILATEWGARL